MQKLEVRQGVLETIACTDPWMTHEWPNDPWNWWKKNGRLVLSTAPQLFQGFNVHQCPIWASEDSGPSASASGPACCQMWRFLLAKLSTYDIFTVFHQPKKTQRLKNHFGYLLVRFPDNHPSIIFYPSNLSLSDGFLSQFHGTYVT